MKCEVSRRLALEHLHLSHSFSLSFSHSTPPQKAVNIHQPLIRFRRLAPVLPSPELATATAAGVVIRVACQQRTKSPPRDANAHRSACSTGTVTLTPAATTTTTLDALYSRKPDAHPSLNAPLYYGVG